MEDHCRAALSDALESCRRELETAECRGIVNQLGVEGRPDRAFLLLNGVTDESDSARPLARLCGTIPNAQPGHVARTVLLLASIEGLSRVAALPVSDRVKQLFADEFQFFANPQPVWLPRFQAGDVRFREMARIATLRRFPAGQFHWEISGFARTWLRHTHRPWRVLAHLLSRMGGFGPFFEFHLNDRRKNRLILLEREMHFSYFRAARSMAKQPEIGGLMTGSWLYCESTARTSPQLAWLTKTPQQEGALLADLGPAPPDSGFLAGSEQRRNLYQAGLYQPRLVCILWPRRHLMAWADRHPEFDQ